jgi:hypothetical protein
MCGIKEEMFVDNRRKNVRGHKEEMFVDNRRKFSWT